IDAAGAGAATPAVSGPIIEGLSVVAPANTVRIITLPAVQWEPVSGPDATGPFSPMAFPNSGGETRVTSRSVHLVPVAPNPAIRQLISDFNRHVAAPPPVVFSITFPFGIRAVALLRHSNHPMSLNHMGATLDLHEPHFNDAGVAGGRQLRAISLGGPGLQQGRSPSFPGATVQLSNGLHNGLPTGKSPLDDSVTTIFNDEFPVSGQFPQVPVEQFEVSGYGESIFSDWKDNTDTDPGISQVRFDVLVGRTSVEIVQARTVMYPYAVRVIRTIKMLRDNAGRVQRTDSGWQAVTDGRYQWPASDADLHSHPGVVLGATNVKNIQETGQTWTSPDGVEFAAVRFDCMVDLDGVVSGAGDGGVPSHGQLGFLQLTHTPPAGMAPSFRDLIQHFGPLGGAVDAVIDVGGSGQQSRVSYVGAGVTEGTTGPEFPMAAWGSPILPKGGPWSVVRRATSSPAPGPVNSTIGVPLIRAGVAGSTPSPSSPYRFADPEDLANESSPAADYALLHTTNTQRVLFPRPKIDVSGARVHQLSSTQQPLLADAFLMSTAGVAPFPALQSAIQFPDADYGLRPEAGGNLALDLAHNDFPVTGGDRVIHDSGGTTFLARYRDEGGTPARVHLEIDGAAAVPWSFQLGGMELCLATSLMGEVIRILGLIEGSATQPGRFTGGTFHFGSALSAIDLFTSFLGTNHIADLPIAARNQPSLEIALKIPIVGAPGEPEEIDVGIGSLADADVTVGVKIDLTTGAPTLKFELDGIITGRTPWPPIVAAGQVKFDIESDATGNMFKFTLGLGAGVDFDIGIGKAEAYFFQNDYFVVGTNEIGFGIGVEIKGKVDLEVVEVEIDVEAAALMVETTCVAGSTWWLVGQLTIGIDVTIAWVIDIDFEVQMQMQTNVDGGPCTNTPMV
ncbi:MAG TPA: hypothetical protein VIN65_04480, partial [Candidatus Dormibacteraeota bacterium]